MKLLNFHQISQFTEYFVKFSDFQLFFCSVFLTCDWLFTEDERWCTITLNKQKLKTKEMGVDVIWQDTVSLFVDSVQYDKVGRDRE